MRFIIVVLILLISINISAQEKTFKEEALDKFKMEHYDESIDLLGKALEKDSLDPEIYYYLGFFNHYRAYDSRPMKGYDYSYTEQILSYLDKAIELDPNYGDAKYFYTAECGANALNKFKTKDVASIKKYYSRAYDKGGFPDWLLELGKNMLNSCDKDAILFAAGDADFNVLTYLQIHTDFRTDISLIPIGYIDRPWYLKLLKDGFDGVLPKIILELTDEQIFDLHPFKWKETSIYIKPNSNQIKKFNLDNDYTFEWLVKPDFTSNRLANKVNSEGKSKRTFLSPRRAMLLQIVEDNFYTKPIYFSNLGNSFFLAGLNQYVENNGFVSRLTPIKTIGIEYENNFKEIEKLLTSENLKDYKTILKSDQPRISGIVFIYHMSFVILADYYKKKGDKKKLQELIKLYEKYLAIEFDKNDEDIYLNKIKS